MFFPRLRRQAKWMFVFLALAFGIGFVAFGVGGNLPGTGVADIFSGGGGTGDQVSASEAREKIRANPKNALAHQQLADALLRDGDRRGAIAALERYTQLRPKDEGGLSQLAGLYYTQTADLQAEVARAEFEIQQASAGIVFAPGLSRRDQAPTQDRISEALTATANERYNSAYTKMQASLAKTVGAYERLARATPDDPNVQYQLAQLADAAGDTDTAITAYRKFIRLAPEDTNAPVARERIRQLRQQANLPSLGPPVSLGTPSGG